MMWRQFGAIYLILGTCIAAGMLGLPVVAAEDHFSFSVLMLITAWVLMTFGAWCLLQVTLEMPKGANMLSMAEKTLGHTVKLVTWFVYLLLLYSLICAYLSASSDLLAHFFRQVGMDIPRWSATVLATLLLGAIVVHGIHSVDLVNRLLMSAKLVICFLLIGTTIPFVHLSNLEIGQKVWDHAAWLIMICAFGYATILPTIYEYLDCDAKQVKRVFYIGSVLPLLLYLVWIFVVQGAVGRADLLSMNHSANTNSLLMTALVSLTHYKAIQSLSVVFISICSITGFLGVSICVFDFLADGLKLNKIGKNKVWLALATFGPPMLIVIVDPSIFIRALSYAGLCCIYILMILPVAMYVAMQVQKRRLKV